MLARVHEATAEGVLKQRAGIPPKAFLPGLSLYYEDLVVGQEFATAGLTVTEEAIIRFGLEWDFQPFHVDEIAAQDSLFGGLIASGIHTVAVTLRLSMHRGLFTGTAVAGLEWGRMRFVRPVRPGDTLRAVVSVTSKRPSGSRPHLGVVTWGVQTYNQEDAIVLDTSITNLVMKRPEAPTPSQNIDGWDQPVEN
jgi:acyl dehydratase